MQAPVVLVGSRDHAFDSIWWDDQAGAALATQHLLDLGHRRIGMISAHPWSQSATPRLDGYKQALAAAGVEFDPTLVVQGDTNKHAGYSEEAGAEGMEQLMALDSRPTAVFASADVQAFGAWSYARDNGIRIPRDVSLLGYDNLKLSRYLDLSTVDQKMHSVGRVAAERLVDRMERSASGERLNRQIELELIPRSSTAPLA